MRVYVLQFYRIDKYYNINYITKIIILNYNFKIG